MARQSYLDRLAVNEKTVQGVESLASTIEMGESDSGNTTANASRTVRDLHSLDGANGRLEVLLWWECRLVNEISVKFMQGVR